MSVHELRQGESAIALFTSRLASSPQKGVKSTQSRKYYKRKLTLRTFYTFFPTITTHIGKQGNLQPCSRNEPFSILIQVVLHNRNLLHKRFQHFPFFIYFYYFFEVALNRKRRNNFFLHFQRLVHIISLELTESHRSNQRFKVSLATVQ